MCAQRNSTEPESFDVAGDGPGGGAQVAGQLGQLYPLAVASVQPFDQRLLSLDAAQGKVTVAGGRGESGGSVHTSQSKDDTGRSGLVRIVGSMIATSAEMHEFFDRYAAALLARDEKAIAAMYAVPALILFPGQAIAVGDATQTQEFFAGSWDQYEGVDTVDKQVVVMGQAPGSLWADVTWSYGGEVRERFCYQLVSGADGYRIAVLTPMARRSG